MVWYSESIAWNPLAANGCRGVLPQFWIIVPARAAPKPKLHRCETYRGQKHGKGLTLKDFRVVVTIPMR